PNCGARKVEWMSSPCSVANDTYSGTSADGRCGAEGTAATIGVMVVDGCSSVAGPPSWGRPSKLRQTIADPTAVSVLRDHISCTLRRTRHQYVCPGIGAKTRELQASAENAWS